MPVIDIPIVSGPDDARNSGPTWPGIENFNNSEAYNILGMDGEGINWYMAGFRFQNITIPAGSTINSSNIHWRAGGDAHNYVEWWIAGEKTLNPTAFAASPTHTPYSAWQNRTTAEVSWIMDETWVQGQTYDSPDIKTVIQELVNQNGWSSGNSIVLTVWHDQLQGQASWRWVEFYEDVPEGTWSISLSIDYTEPSTEGKYYFIYENGYLKIYSNNLLVQSLGDGNVSPEGFYLDYSVNSVNIYVNNILVQSFSQ